MTQPLVYITSNPLKAARLKDYISFSYEHLPIDLPEIQSLDLEEVVRATVTTAYERVKRPVFVEDTSLRNHALGNVPGPLVKWVINELTPTNVCRLLDQFDDRSATVEIMLGYFDGNEYKFILKQGRGEIAKQAAGLSPWTYDFFIPEGSNMVWAAMSEAEQHRTSVRRIVFEEFEQYLTELT